MADNFAPIVWSTHIQTSLQREMVFANIVNRKFEGDVKNVGEYIKILGVARPTVTQITDPNAQLSAPELVSDYSTLIKVSQQDLIMYLVGDVDRVQSVEGYVEALASESAQAYASKADAFIAGLYSRAGKKVTLASATKGNIMGKLYEAQEHLMENDVPFDDVVAVVSPKMWSRIAEATQEVLTLNTDLVERGKMCMHRGISIYVSNNLAKCSETGHHALVMSRGAIAYYEQIDEVEKFRESDYIGDIIRCLHTYGADVVRAKELVDLEISSYA